MIISGRVQNGVVVLEPGTTLPEGSQVNVVYVTAPRAPRSELTKVQFPLVPSDRPGSVKLTGAQIAELLEDDDAVSRH